MLYHHKKTTSAAGRAHLRCLRDAGAPVLTKPADVPALGPAAEELFTLESRCTDLYVLARPYLTLAAPGQDYRTTPVIVKTDAAPPKGGGRVCIHCSSTT